MRPFCIILIYKSFIVALIGLELWGFVWFVKATIVAYADKG